MPTARSMRTWGLLPSGVPIMSAVAWSVVTTDETVAAGVLPLNTAIAPEMIGVDIDVPVSVP